MIDVDPESAFVEAFETTVDVRYGDLDTYGHVNNAVLATLLEEARIDFFEAVLGRDALGLLAGDGDGPGIVVANLELDFRRPLPGPGTARVAVVASDVGTSSVTLTYAVRTDGEGGGEGERDDAADTTEARFADGTLHALGETTMVTVDRETGSPEPMPSAWREALTDDLAIEETD